MIQFALTPELKSRLWGSLLMLLALWVIHRLLLFFISHRIRAFQARYRWRKNAVYIVVVIGGLGFGLLWLPHIQSIATFLGLLSAGFAVALQEPIANFMAWGFIKWRHLFEIGDRVQIGAHKGDVVDIRIFQFTLLEIGNWVAADQSTGRVLHIPNSWVFEQALSNYHKGLGYIWHEVPVHVTFESDWEKAKEILQKIVENHAMAVSEKAAVHLERFRPDYMIIYTKLTPIVYVRGEQNGVLLTLRYLCDPRRRRSTEQAIWEDILRAFIREPDIEFAYPTHRLYTHAVTDIVNSHEDGYNLSEGG